MSSPFGGGEGEERIQSIVLKLFKEREKPFFYSLFLFSLLFLPPLETDHTK